MSRISGQWAVPTITAGSSAGDASTWIGAEGSTGSFVQVGTIENQFQSPRRTQYFAFWSDTAKGYYPLRLIRVNPGDTIVARMVKVRLGWKVAIDDVTSGTSGAAQTNYGRGSQFSTAQWFQENPVYSQFDHTSYPSLSTVTIKNMKLDGAAPPLTYQDGETLSTENDTFLVPTRVRHDSFSLVPATGYALDFLQDVYIADELNSEFFESATQGIEPGNPATNQYLAGVDFELSLLQADAWPRRVSGEVDSYVASQKHLESLVTQWLEASSSVRHRTFSNIVNALLQSDDVANGVRARLGLPPLND
jgi:hypothetical protein